MKVTHTSRIRIDIDIPEPQRFDVSNDGERVQISHVWHADSLRGNYSGLIWGSGVVYRKDGTLGVAKRSQIVLHEHELPTHVLVALRDGHAKAVGEIIATVHARE